MARTVTDKAATLESHVPEKFPSVTAMNGELSTSAERHHRHHIHHLESDSTANHQQQLQASSAGVMYPNSQQHTCQALPASGVAPFQLPTSSFARSGSRSPSVSSLTQLTVAAAVVSAADSISNSNGLPVVSGLPPPPPLPPIFRQIPFSFTAAATLGCATVGPLATQSQSVSSITSSPSSLLRNSSGHIAHHRPMPCLTLPPSHQFNAASGSDKHHHHSQQQQQTSFCFHHHSGSGVGVGGTAGSGGMGGGTGGPGTTASSTADNNACRLIEYRGAQVAAFQVDGRELICLPQAFDLFLKHLVGGLHTVYTKLKRLDITPVVCNVEQVRVLRGLGAIQPGVNRCKLISPREFDVLYDDCTNSSARPGRPPKRTSTMSTAEVALEHIKQSKLSGFTDFYSQTRLLADAKKALTGFAGSGPGGASAAAAAAAAVSGFLPYLDFKKSPLFAAAAAAAAAASSCYSYQHHPAAAAGPPTLTAPHHPSLTGPTPLLPPPAVGPSAVDSTAHLPAAFVPFGSAAYHAGMMSLAASVHAAQQLRRHQSAVAAVASIRNAADELQRLHTGNGSASESVSSRPNPEPEEIMVDAENEQLLASRRARSLCRTPSHIRRSRSKDDLTGNLGNTILYENNIGRHNGRPEMSNILTITSNRLHRSDYLVNAARSRLFQDVDEVDMPLNLEPAFRRQLKAVSQASLRSQSPNSSVDSQERASRDDIIVDDTDGQSIRNDDSADHVERNRLESYHENQLQLGAQVNCENAKNLHHAADSYGDTSSSEEGKIPSRIRMGRSRSSSGSQSKARSRSRSQSEPRDQSLNDGLHEEDDFNIQNDTEADGTIDNRSKSIDCEKHWHSVVPAADLLRDQFLQYLPGVGCGSNTTDVDKSLVPAFQTGLSPSSAGYSVEVLLANVQGLLKAVVDGARQREQEADIEKDNLRRKLKRERENRRQLERRLVSVASGESDRSVSDSFDSTLHGFGCNRSNQRNCVSQKDGCSQGCGCCTPAALDGTENRKPHTLSGFGDEMTHTGTAV